MDPIGLVDSINDAAIKIDSGRKGFAIVGEERKGRIAYEKGIAEALNAFKEAQVSANPQIIITAEYTFLTQELNLCDPSDKNALTSLKSAIESFDDAFRCLEVVENHVIYQEVEKTYRRHKSYRFKGFPKDAFHIACASHKARLSNSLKTVGLDPIEKSLLEQRTLNLTTAQNSYAQKQKTALIAP
ncbi:MAG: hypothetical protein FWE57_07395 [Chitinispirillia bacterium]|nr:hypothetical protein [Chitinispirillia bacterium]